MRRVALACATLLALAGCKRNDMYTQDKRANWDRDSFFRDASSMRPPVPGTVPRNPTDPDIAQPAAITPAMLARGQARYDIFCAGCHGQSGDGLGMITQRGFPQPAAIAADEVQHTSAAGLYAVITNGQGAMYSFAARVPSGDRWAIVAYIRALQISQAADPARLPPSDQAQLAASQ